METSITFCLFLFLISLPAEAKDSRKVYLVHTDGGSHGNLAVRSAHLDILEQVIEKDRRASESLLYSYKESFTGFAARLTDEERRKLEDRAEILAVEERRKLKLQTTRSWDFIGFPTNVNRSEGSAESDIVVGVFDSGIWPDSPSFLPDGLGPPPSKWKGTCHNITCTNKIIGARAYYTGADPLDEKMSVIDEVGHGTHVASIAAGREVRDANFFGLGRGIARGAVPSARIAVYKVCWVIVDGFTCEEQDVLAAFDDAIQDGVDVISASVVFPGPDRYDNDSVAIGSFRAMKNGVLSVFPAGNFGPEKFTVENSFPWALTVAANIIDRKFVGEVVLGNGQSLYGNTINSFQTQSSFYPLEQANAFLLKPTEDCSGRSAKFERTILEGERANVITPFSVDAIMSLSNSSTAGIIVTGEVCDGDEAVSLPLAGVCLGSDAAVQVNHYYASSGNPLAKIQKSHEVFDEGAPAVAGFSSRGPNLVSPDILKPDITAPGVDILAAWPPSNSPTIIYPDDIRNTKYNILFGTSMACPHVSGVALYVKAFHPTWSPAAIKSALMTTATPMSPASNPEAELAYGAGQLNPVQATNPGLVYDATESDYIKFLCVEGYSNQEIEKITGDNNIDCKGTVSFSTRHLNYPSLSAKVSPDKDFNVEFKRMVTNIGTSGSVYNAEVEEPQTGLRVDVDPTVLSFADSGKVLEFSVIVSGEKLANGTSVSASLVWSDGDHKVRSPILIYAG